MVTKKELDESLARTTTEILAITKSQLDESLAHTTTEILAITKNQLDESLAHTTTEILAITKNQLDESLAHTTTQILTITKNQLDESLNGAFEKTKKSIDESAERAMNNMLHEMKLLRDHMDLRFAGIDTRFAGIEARLDRQAGLIQSGARALLRVDRWADATDHRISEMSDHIYSLEARITRLEDRS